jgi:hypothetical protein
LLWTELGISTLFFLLILCKIPKGAISLEAESFKFILSQITETMGTVPSLPKSVWISVTVLMESELKGKPLPSQRGNIDVLGMA